jgi:hypothetical protein
VMLSMRILGDIRYYVINDNVNMTLGVMNMYVLYLKFLNVIP